MLPCKRAVIRASLYRGQLSVLPCTEGSCPCFLVQSAVVLASLYRGQLSVLPSTEGSCPCFLVRGQLSVLPYTEGSCPCFLVQRAVVRASLYRGQNGMTCWGLGACLAWAVHQGDTGGHEVGGDESMVGRWRSVCGATGAISGGQTEGNAGRSTWSCNAA